jgi:hypothetical protein
LGCQVFLLGNYGTFIGVRIYILREGGYTIFWGDSYFYIFKTEKSFGAGDVAARSLQPFISAHPEIPPPAKPLQDRVFQGGSPSNVVKSRVPGFGIFLIFLFFFRVFFTHKNTTKST